MVSVVLLGQVIGCANQKVQKMINVENIKTTSKKFEFEYKIKNKYAHDIWICDDIDVYNNNIRVETKIEEKALRIKSKSFVVPKDILLEEAIYSKYIRLTPNNTYEGQISLKLPVVNMSPINLNARDEIRNKITKILKDVIFEVGFYKEDLSKKGLTKKNNPNVAYVNCFWAEKNREDSLSVEIKDVRIPTLQ